MAANAQFLSETQTKHIKQCAKVLSFKRTFLEGHTTSQTVFIGVFVSIWQFLAFFTQKLQYFGTYVLVSTLKIETVH